MAILTWLYTFSSAVVEPPTSNQVRFDADVYSSVTAVWVTLQTTDGIDVYRGLMGLAIGTRLYVQDKNDHTLFAEFRTIAAAVDRGSYVALPVAFVAGSGTLNNNQAIVLLAETPATTDDTGGGGVPGAGPDLVTLDTAKRHLNITDVDHDPDVQQKLTAASATIRDYLKGRNDPTWTPDTVPPWIAGAVLLLLGHLYEHRGDEFGNFAQDNDRMVWDAIANLCRRSRDPALA